MLRAALAVLGAAVLWGSIGVLSALLFRTGSTPWEVAFWRAALAGLAVAGYVLAARRSVLLPERPSDLLWLAGFGAVGVAVFYAAFQLAIAGTSVAVAVVLLYLAPVMVATSARIVLREQLTLARWIMILLVVGGVWATALGAMGAEIRVSAPGVVWGVIAAAAYTSYYLFGKRLVPRLGITRTLLVSLLVGAALLGTGMTAAGTPPRIPPDRAAWLLLVALALGPTILANVLYYRGLARMEASRAAVIASIEPVVASLLALLLLHEGLSPLGWVGIGLVVAGVIAAPLERIRASRTARGLPATRTTGTHPPS